ncbi:MAG: Rieske 2Fe-2S domain-containing protein [Rhodospirillales bacterium]
MATAYEHISWPSDGVNRIPYQIYTDPEVYDQEQQKLFRGPTWNFVALEQEVPNPGDYKTTYVGDTPVAVIRDETGAINVLVNRCAHRGNLVCIKTAGNADRLTCVYHNWTYDLQGNLTSVAFRRGLNNKGGMPADFEMAQNGMRRLRVETLAGLVFATFSDAAPPLADYIGPEMLPNVERVVGRRMKVLGTYSQYMPNNWKLYMENVRDSYHASLLHLFQATFRINRLSMDGGIKLSDRGWHHISYSIGATDREEAEYSADKLRAVSNEYTLADPSLIDKWNEYPCGTTLAIQSIFPNFVVQQISNSIAVRLCLPKGPEACELLWWVLGTDDDTAEQRDIRIRQSNMIGPGGLISMEDGVVGGWVQRGTKGDKDKSSVLEMGGRTVEPSKESRATEVSIRGFWNGYRECMEGRVPA